MHSVGVVLQVGTGACTLKRRTAISKIWHIELRISKNIPKSLAHKYQAWTCYIYSNSAARTSPLDLVWYCLTYNHTAALIPHKKHGYYIQARSQGGFERVWTNPLSGLAIFIFNEAAAVQGTII